MPPDFVGVWESAAVSQEDNKRFHVVFALTDGAVSGTVGMVYYRLLPRGHPRAARLKLTQTASGQITLEETLLWTSGKFSPSTTTLIFVDRNHLDYSFSGGGHSGSGQLKRVP